MKKIKNINNMKEILRYEYNQHGGKTFWARY